MSRKSSNLQRQIGLVIRGRRTRQKISKDEFADRSICTNIGGITMDLQETAIVAVCMRFRTRAKKLMREADELAGARDLVRLTASATTLEWAAGDLAILAGISLPDASPEGEDTTARALSKVVHLEPRRMATASAIDLSRIYRAHVEADPGSFSLERMAYIESALGEDSARQRLVAILSAWEFVKPEEMAERVSNCQSARQVIKEGVSEDRELRLFEAARSGDKVTAFVREPLFLLREPAALIRKWASIPWE